MRIDKSLLPVEEDHVLSLQAPQFLILGLLESQNVTNPLEPP